jgi:hypothetical protein
MTMPLRTVSATLIGVGCTLFVLAFASAAAIADQLRGGPACPLGNPGDVCFGMPPAPQGGIVRQLNFVAPGPGQVLVMVNGSGWCSNFSDQGEEVADFATQIVNRPNAAVEHTGPGGLRFLNRLPRATQPEGGNIIVPINYSSSRTFPVRRAGTQRFFLKLSAIQLDAHVSCNAYALNMTVLFIAD